MQAKIRIFAAFHKKKATEIPQTSPCRRWDELDFDGCEFDLFKQV